MTFVSKMKITIKRIIGQNNTNRIKSLFQLVKYYDDKQKKRIGQIKSNLNFKVYELEDKHLFFGYYDIPQSNNNNDKLLVHKLGLGAIAGQDSIYISYIDKKANNIVDISKSYAWNWQQGSRLRWNNICDDEIYFNNYYENEYCTELWDIKSKRLIKRYNEAFYDISSDGKYGLSLDFSRLQRLRPGYGYCNKKDKTKGICAPENDGIVYVNLETEAKEKIIDLSELARENNISSKYESYINHISISPDSRFFIFFYLWTLGAGMPWKNCMYMYDIANKTKKIITKDIIVSHYCWHGNNNLIITSIEGNYYNYDFKNNEVSKLENKVFIHDGHPSVVSDNKLLSDTYPLDGNFQTLFTASIEGDEYKELAQIYSDPRMFGEYRCDTHPRLFKDNKSVTVDSTFSGLKKRCIIEFYL